MCSWGERVTHVLITHHHHDHVESLHLVEKYAPRALLVGKRTKYGKSVVVVIVVLLSCQPTPTRYRT